MTTNVIVLTSEPGIQRDGTPYDSKSYIDGQWVRFYDGRPTKIGGYKLIDHGTPSIIRTIYNYDNPDLSNFVDSYLGREDSVGYERFDYNGFSAGGFVNRTPAGYIPVANNLWNFDVFTKADLTPLIIAHVAPNANDSTSNVEGFIYSGPANDESLLTPVMDSSTAGLPVKVSGGVIFATPLLIAYGNNGQIRWSNPGEIDNWKTGTDQNTQTIANTKILKMALARGSSFPQLLAWTSNSVISLSYDISEFSGNNFFKSVTIDNKITVMSANSIVGYANQYFWIGLNQFYFFNGIVQPLQNTINAQYFFEKVELRSRGKIWGEIVNPPTGGTEIWWHYPEKVSGIINQECTHALIYHVEIKKWSDVAINRAAGAQIGPFPLPMMSDNQLLSPANTYPLWMHEYGYDKVIGPNSFPIQSYFETHIYDFFEGNPANNRLMRTRRIEPDFKMTKRGPNATIPTRMTVEVHNRFFPSDSIENGKMQIKGPYIFDNNTQKIDDVNSQGRLVSYRFDSNELEGGYMMGKTLLNYDIGDIRPSGNGSSGN